MIDRMVKDIYDVMERIEKEYQALLKDGDVRIPSIDMYEENGELVIKAEIPGVKKDNISVEAGKDFIEIQANMEKESDKKKRNYFRRERMISQYYRKIQLPFEVEPKNISARYENGILEIRVKRVEGKKVRINIE